MQSQAVHYWAWTCKETAGLASERFGLGHAKKRMGYVTGLVIAGLWAWQKRGSWAFNVLAGQETCVAGQLSRGVSACDAFFKRLDQRRRDMAGCVLYQSVIRGFQIEKIVIIIQDNCW